MLLKVLGVPVVLGLTIWGVLAVEFASGLANSPRLAVEAIFGLLGIATVLGLFVRRLRPSVFAFALALCLLAVWWRGIQPSNDRNWQPEVAVLAKADLDGDRVTIHNIRNFDYRTEFDFTPHYYDKTFDLAKLDGLDLVASYWMGDAIAHLMVSFGFGEDDHLAISIETRKEQGESYSTLAGFFRQYELYYVVADERDLIRVRTNYRKDPPEDVYVYPVNIPRENLRRLFLDYVREINALNERPTFYNTATTNCTTNIWVHTQVNQRNPFSWKILLSGHTPEYVYERGRLNTSMPFDELRRRSHINEAAQRADTAADFSRQIRIALPPAAGVAAPDGGQ